MDKDIITFKEEIPKHDYFSLLILGGGVDITRNLKEVYEEPVEIQILVNGQQVMVKDFRDVMQNWGNRIGNQYKEKYERLTKDSGVMRLAKELLKAKTQKFRAFIDHMESMCDDAIYDFDYEEFSELELLDSSLER